MVNVPPAKSTFCLIDKLAYEFKLYCKIYIQLHFGVIISFNEILIVGERSYYNDREGNRSALKVRYCQ